MKRLSLLVVAPLLAGLSLLAAAAPRPAVDLHCVSFGSGPQLECTVRLRDADGKPLAGANVTLGAMMPSMPMVHQVKPAAAAPTGTPGEYRARLELEMNGAWAVQVDIAGPVRDRVARTMQIDECEGDRRCPVHPAHPVHPVPPAAAKAAPKPLNRRRQTP